MQVIGHLGRDCNVNTVNGKNVINFSVAHTEKFKDAAGVQKEKTTWVNCSWWIDRTAVAQYLVKGTLVYADGIPEVKSYQAEDRSWRAELKLRVNTLQLLGGKKEGEGGSTDAQPQSTGYVPAPATSTHHAPDDDLPF